MPLVNLQSLFDVLLGFLPAVWRHTLLLVVVTVVLPRDDETSPILCAFPPA